MNVRWILYLRVDESAVFRSHDNRVWHGGDLLPHDAHHLVHLLYYFFIFIFYFLKIFLSPWHLGLLLGHPLAGQDLLHLLDSRPLVLGLLEVRGGEDGLGVAHAQSQCSNKITWSASTNLRPEVERFKCGQMRSWGKVKAASFLQPRMEMITKEHMLPKAGLDYFTETVNKIEAEKELLKRNIWRVLLTVRVLDGTM